ncbi:hypothetical protein ABH941_007742 [Streptacidiphilus sp. EB103A]
MSGTCAPGQSSGAGALHACNGSVWWGELAAASRARARKEGASRQRQGRGRLGSGAERFAVGGGGAPRLQRQRPVERVNRRLPASARKDAASSPSTSCRGYPMRDRGRGRPGSGAERSPGARGGGLRACRSGVGEVQPHPGECWTRSASRIHPRVRPDVPNDPVRGPFERFDGLLGGVTTTLGAVATIYGCNSPQHGCNSPQPGAHAPPRQETGVHLATHAPPTAPLLVVGQRAERATPARDRPACPREVMVSQRERTRTSEAGSGRGLGRGGVSPARSAWGGTPLRRWTTPRLPRPPRGPHVN